MREVLYTKYNSRRRPIYQLSTSIVQDGDRMFAMKKAIQPRAQQHLKNLIDNRAKLMTLYEDVQLVECYEKEDAIFFPFIKGHHLLDDIDLVNDSLEEVMSELELGLKKISSYKKDMTCSFEMTESFRKVFEGCEPKKTEVATKVANIDSLFANFVVLSDGKLCCIDYEWVMDFPIPVRYITFRNLYYFYNDNISYLKDKISKEKFYQYFGYEEPDIALYTKMEEIFQQYVHGKNWAYMYPERYKKKTTIWAEIESDRQIAKMHPELIDEMVKETHRLSGQIGDHIAEIEHLREEVKYWAAIAEEKNAYATRLVKAIKNPLYGLRLLLGKLFGK